MVSRPTTFSRSVLSRCAMQSRNLSMAKVQKTATINQIYAAESKPIPEFSPSSTKSSLLLNESLISHPFIPWYRPNKYLSGSTIMENISSPKEAFTTLLMEQFSSDKPDDINQVECFEQVGWTPLIEIEPNLYAKLEGENYSGSAKDRAIISMIYAMYMDNKLKQNDTICLVTSGSAAKSLLMLHEALQEFINIEFNVICVIPSAYKQKPIVQSILRNIPTDNGRAELVFPDGLFVDILTQYKQICNDNTWIMLDQHYDYNASIGHRITGIEIQTQFDSLMNGDYRQINDIVVPTGTGATMTGIKHILKQSNNINFHSRKSLSLKSSGAVIDGLSDVNKYNNFCDSTSLNGYNNQDPFDPHNALKYQKKLESDYGIEASLSSGASYWLARELQAENPENSIVFICPDGKRSKYTNRHNQSKQIASHQILNC